MPHDDPSALADWYDLPGDARQHERRRDEGALLRLRKRGRGRLAPERLLRGLRAAELVPGAGHALPSDRPDFVNARLLRSFGEIG